MSIIQFKFKKFPDRHLYLLLLIPLLFIVHHSINGLAAPPGYNNHPVLNLDFEGGKNQSIFGSDFEGGKNQSIFGSDFERQNVTISPTASGQFSFVINNESSSLSTTKLTSVNNSLRVVVKPSNDTTNWNTISTDFIPVNENANYNTSLYISAKDVNQLHSKIVYFDSNKSEIKSVLMSVGRNGTFQGPYNIVDSSPNGTKYLKVEILSRSSPKIPGSYLVYNEKIENVPLGQVGFINRDKAILSLSTEKNSPISGKNSLRVNVKPSSNTTNWNTISTDFIPVSENADYNTSLYISAKDVNQLHSKIVYFDSNKTEIKSVVISGGRNGTFQAPYNIFDSSPNGTKYLQVQILSKSSPKIPGSYLVDNVKIENVPLGQVGFTNHDKAILSISTEKNSPISGNNSLRVDVKPSSNTTNWNTISTDFIPVNENANYNASLYISAKGVNQLHSKIVYFDSNKSEIKSVVISGGRNGTFQAPYNIVDSSPNGTKYLQLQILSKSSPKIPGSYLVDNVKIENVPFVNRDKAILSISTEKNSPISGKNSLRVDVKPSSNTTNWNTISTDFIPVNENAFYNASLYISAKDVNQLHSKIVYFDSNKSEIKSVVISGGRNGTFQAPYDIVDSSPNGTKYLQLQILSRSSPKIPGSYLVDNVKIGNIG